MSDRKRTPSEAKATPLETSIFYAWLFFGIVAAALAGVFYYSGYEGRFIAVALGGPMLIVTVMATIALLILGATRARRREAVIPAITHTRRADGLGGSHRMRR